MADKKIWQAEQQAEESGISYVGLKMDSKRVSRLKRVADEATKQNLFHNTNVSVRAVIDWCVDQALPQLEVHYGITSETEGSPSKPVEVKNLALPLDVEAHHVSLTDKLTAAKSAKDLLGQASGVEGSKGQNKPDPAKRGAPRPKRGK